MNTYSTIYNIISLYYCSSLRVPQEQKAFILYNTVLYLLKKLVDILLLVVMSVCWWQYSIDCGGSGRGWFFYLSLENAKDRKKQDEKNKQGVGGKSKRLLKNWRRRSQCLHDMMMMTWCVCVCMEIEEHNIIQ